MSAATPKSDRSASPAATWNLKGIDPSVRELAQDVARRSGLTLAEWLNQLISGAGEEAYLYPQRPNSAAILDTVESPRSVGSVERVVAIGGETKAKAKRARGPRKLHLVGDTADVPSPKSEPVEFVTRLEAVEREMTACGAQVAALGEKQNDGAQITALEVSIRKMMAQMRQSEAHAELQALQVRENLRALRHRVDRLESQPTGDIRLTRLAARLDAFESDPALPIDERLVGLVISRLIGGVEQAQNRAIGSLQSLEGCLIRLEQVVGKVAIASSISLMAEMDLATSVAPGVGELGRFMQVPDGLIDEAAEAAMAQAAPQADSKGLDVESFVRGLSDQVAATEHRSAEAIFQMSDEVTRIAQRLDDRLGEVQHRSDKHAAEIGDEIAHLAAAVDDRISRADNAREGALGELGGQIGIIVDQLADNIAASEHRSALIMAQGLDTVSERLQRAITQLNLHHDRASSELADLVRQGEKRTEQLIAEACEHIQTAQVGLAPQRPVKSETAINEPKVPSVRSEASSLNNSAQARSSTVELPPTTPRPEQGRPESRVELSPADTPRLNKNRELIDQARAAARLSAETERRSTWKSRVDTSQNDAAQKNALVTEDVLVLRNGLGSLLKRHRS